MVERRGSGWALLVGALLWLGMAHAEERIEPVLGDDGLYHQEWFLVSFLDMRDDLKEAQAAGKRFAVLWEQKGCPYCRDLHQINFADPKINHYVRDNFVIVQLNLWGSREVTDFDGEVLPEKDMARKWGVVFTPTMQFFAEANEVKAGKGGRDQMIWVMPGYFRKGHFMASFEYVKQRRYETQHFQNYIAERLAAHPVGE